MRARAWPLVSMTAFVVVACLGFFAGYEEEAEHAYVLAAGESLRVHGLNGSITYEPWPGDEVVIHATTSTRALTYALAESLADRFRPVFSREADGVSVMVPSGPFPIVGSVSVTYHIRVPREWSGRVSLSTSNGPITAEQVHGDVELWTSNGRISVEEHTGSLEARTSNGRIELVDVETALRAETSNGGVYVRGVLTRDGWLGTSNGPIDLRARLAPGAAYTARTSNGEVNVSLMDADVALDLATSNAPIHLRSEIVASHIDRDRVVGRIGSGAARLEVRTSNGTITFSGLSGEDRA